MNLIYTCGDIWELKNQKNYVYFLFSLAFLVNKDRYGRKEKKRSAYCFCLCFYEILIFVHFNIELLLIGMAGEIWNVHLMLLVPIDVGSEMASMGLSGTLSPSIGNLSHLRTMWDFSQHFCLTSSQLQLSISVLVLVH
jgi:hypothetical protein